MICRENMVVEIQVCPDRGVIESDFEDVAGLTYYDTKIWLSDRETGSFEWKFEHYSFLDREQDGTRKVPMLNVRILW